MWYHTHNHAGVAGLQIMQNNFHLTSKESRAQSNLFSNSISAALQHMLARRITNLCDTIRMSLLLCFDTPTSMPASLVLRELLCFFVLFCWGGVNRIFYLHAPSCWCILSSLIKNHKSYHRISLLSSIINTSNSSQDWKTIWYLPTRTIVFVLKHTIYVIPLCKY